MARIYVAGDADCTVVSRRRVRLAGGRPVRRSWSALVETTVSGPAPARTSSLGATALVAGPPVLVGALTTAFAPLEFALAAGGVTFFAMSYLGPLVRRRRAGGGPRPVRGGAFRLTRLAERAAFDRVLATADRISETWPGLGSLLAVVDAEAMLADALWEIAGVLARRQELSGVLAELSRPEFRAAHPGDDTAHELHEHHRSARQAMAEVESELAAREANLRRVEQAGLSLVRELQMREAIRAAEQSLRTAQSAAAQSAAAQSAAAQSAGAQSAGDQAAGALSAAALSAAALSGAAVPADPAAELAEHTQSVLAAYRELTVAPLPGPPPAA